MNGSLLVAYCCTTIFPCYMSLEINQSMQGPNGHYDKDYRVGQLPSLLGNMQIYNFPLTAQAKLIACRLLYWLTFQSRWKVESLTRNRIFERTKQQNEEFFCKTQHILFPSQSAFKNIRHDYHDKESDQDYFCEQLWTENYGFVSPNYVNLCIV